MAGGEFLNHAGCSRELISGEGVRNDQHSTMWALVIEESNRESNEIIPVSGHQTSFFCRCKLELPLIRCLAHPSLMSAECVHSTFSKYLGNLRTEVFIQVKLHDDALMEPHGQSEPVVPPTEIPSYAKASTGYPPVAKSTEASSFGHSII